MKRFEGKVVLITGGSSGIGQDSAIAFAQEGAKVVVTDVDEAKGKNVVESIRKNGGEATFYRLDVSKAEENREVIEKIVEKYSRLDIAFNNAGVGGPLNPLGEYPIASAEKVININLMGVLYGMRYEIEQMMKQKEGVIINNSSILGRVGFENAAPYVASKHGVVGLTKAAALEYARHNIRINAVNPAFIKTPMLENAGMSEGSEVYQMLVSLHPIGRLGEPREVTKAILFLASDDASFIHGETLMVDGGYIAK